MGNARPELGGDLGAKQVDFIRRRDADPTGKNGYGQQDRGQCIVRFRSRITCKKRRV